MTQWTEERRKKHAEAIRKWKPWEKSTGPKTLEGKVRSSMNAYKHGKRTIRVSALLVAVRKQKQLHDYAMRYAKGAKTNELFEDPIIQWLQMAILRGRDEIAALLDFKIMQKPCNFEPPEGNS